MEPLLVYAATAALLGWAAHRRNWGLAAFAAAMLAWMLVVQVADALLSLRAAGLPV